MTISELEAWINETRQIQPEAGVTFLNRYWDPQYQPAREVVAVRDLIADWKMMRAICERHDRDWSDSVLRCKP
jgi:hypothetical protein